MPRLPYSAPSHWRGRVRLQTHHVHYGVHFVPPLAYSRPRLVSRFHLLRWIRGPTYLTSTHVTVPVIVFTSTIRTHHRMPPSCTYHTSRSECWNHRSLVLTCHTRQHSVTFSSVCVCLRVYPSSWIYSYPVPSPLLRTTRVSPICYMFTLWAPDTVILGLATYFCSTVWASKPSVSFNSWILHSINSLSGTSQVPDNLQ